MYMITRGNSGIPLIKLSEGFSYNQNEKYVTVVCGSNGEKLKPIKVWQKPFLFFGKEQLNAEFISKMELIYVKVSENTNFYLIDVVKYRLPEYMIGNLELEYEAIRKAKPMTETLFHIELGKDTAFEIFDDAISTITNGAFKDAIKQAMNKFVSDTELAYAK